MKDKRNIIKKKYEELYWRLHNHPNKNVDNDEWQDDFKWVRNQINDYCSTAKISNRRFDKQRFIDYIDNGVKS